MTEHLKIIFNNELDLSKSYIRSRDFDNAFFHLERAHVLGQEYVIPHTLIHWNMLKVGLLRRDGKEVIGQLIRLPLGIIGSFIGIIPTGNTGGSNVSIFKKMTIDKDLLEVLERKREG